MDQLAYSCSCYNNSCHMTAVRLLTFQNSEPNHSHFILVMGDDP